MSTTSTHTRQFEVWIGLLRAHAAVTRQFSAELLAEHGLTINDFDVLIQLSAADEGMLRRVDLAGRVLLTPSGITRLLEGLERAGYVERRSCESDARVSYAALTGAGREKLEAARVSHRAAVQELFSDRFTDDELDTLLRLVQRLPALESSCEPAE